MRSTTDALAFSVLGEGNAGGWFSGRFREVPRGCELFGFSEQPPAFTGERDAQAFAGDFKGSGLPVSPLTVMPGPELPGAEVPLP